MRPILLCFLLSIAPDLGWAQDAGVPEVQDAGIDAGEGLPGSGDRVKEMSNEAILRIARTYNAEGRTLLAKGDPAGALAAFKYAFELSGQRDAEAANNAGFAWFRLNDREQARQWYEKSIALDARRGLAWQNLAELYTGPEAQAEDLEKAATYLARAREFQGNKPFLVRLQARVAAQQGRFTEALRQYLAIQPQTDALRLEVGDFLTKYARDEEAIEWFAQITEPEIKTQAEERIRALRLARVAAEFELSLSIEGVPAQARQYFQLAETLARRHAAGWLFDEDEAVRLLEEALLLAPLYAEANVLLGDLLAGRDAPRAELAWLRALAVNGRNVDVLVRVADLHQRAGRATAAVSFLGRAVEVAPERNDLRLRLARAWRAAGNVQRALAHLETYLAEGPGGVEAREARALKRSLEAVVPSAPPEPVGPEPTPAEAVAVSRATRFISEDLLKEALNELVELPEPARGPRAHSLMAYIMRRLGRVEDAIAAYQASLADERDQPAVLLALGELLLDGGQADAARALLEEAELGGAVEASLAVARMDALPSESLPGIVHDFQHLRSLRRARERLEDYVDHPEAAYRSDAATLLRDVRGRVQGVYAVGGLLACVLLGGLGLVARRRWGGKDLEALITRAPEAGPEVQRVLSAIRHEVLKHNTMVLTGLVEAITDDDADSAAKAAWARRSLLGDPAGGDLRDAAGERLKDYADELTRIGRSHGMRLDLGRRDTAISALLQGFSLLQKAAPALDRYARLSRGGRRRLQRRLEHATRLLNVEGYEAVRALLDRLRVLRIDRALLEGVFHRTRREPAFSGVKFAPLTLDDTALPCGVAMPRHAFEDVVANLIRNAIQASTRQNLKDSVYIGLATATDVDPITGLAWLTLRVRDRVVQGLAVEVLRGRMVEEGLGLTAELVSRYEGALDVEADTAPWTKAVVVRLPRVEDEEPREASDDRNERP
jgi:tetratricopeptide (TPR) repeat protein